MKHGFVVMDNDTPLCIAQGQPQAERALAHEKLLLGSQVMQNIAGNTPEESYTYVQRQQLNYELGRHHLHWRQVPFFQE